VSRPASNQVSRVAFGYGHPDLGLRLVDLQSARAEGAAVTATPFCDATRVDWPGRFSGDGTRVAFTSDRGGRQQVWVANRDGSALRSVTAFDDAAVNVGSWSPDGRDVTFDAVVAGDGAIYVVGADGGPVKQLTQSAASRPREGFRVRDADPEWSRDDRWIYYSSNASGQREIWRIPATGGTAVQITRQGGFEPRESPDGGTIYYVDKLRRNGFDTVAAIKQVPATGGPETVVFSGVSPGAWDITTSGIVFATGDPGPMPAPGVADALNFYAFGDRRVRRLGLLPFIVTRFVSSRLLAASRDGRWALVSHIDSWERDILVADNFR
jgi:Tol biopolymer transport system component